MATNINSKNRNDLNFFKYIQTIEKLCCLYRCEVLKFKPNIKILFVLQLTIYLIIQFYVTTTPFIRRTAADRLGTLYFTLDKIFSVYVAVEIFSYMSYAYFTRAKLYKMKEQFIDIIEQYPKHRLMRDYRSNFMLLILYLTFLTSARVILVLVSPPSSIIITVWKYFNGLIHSVEVIHLKAMCDTIKEMIFCVDKHVTFWNADIDNEFASEVNNLLIWNRETHELNKDSVPEIEKKGQTECYSIFRFYQSACFCSDLFNDVFGIPAFFIISAVFLKSISSIFLVTAVLKLNVHSVLNGPEAFDLWVNTTTVVVHLSMLVALFNSCEGVHVAQMRLRRTLATRAALGRQHRKDFLCLSKAVEARGPRLCAGPIHLRMALVPAMFALVATNTIVLLQLTKIV